MVGVTATGAGWLPPLPRGLQASLPLAKLA